jgi:hypothetical protein
MNQVYKCKHVLLKYKNSTTMLKLRHRQAR